MLFYDLIGSAARVRQPSVLLSSDVAIKAKSTIASEINDAVVPRHRSNPPESTSTKTPPNDGNGEFSIYSHPSTLISSQQVTPSIVTRLKDSLSNDVAENTLSNIADPEHLPQVQNGLVDFETATLLPNVGGADVLQQGSSRQYLKPQESFLFIAASIPLPDGTDSELTESEYQDSVITAPEISIASSVSDYDDDNHDDNHNPNATMDYKSTETIIVPQFKKDGEEESVERALSPGTS
ncbi:hypothetical protein B0O99DRAFT_681935 [Bisporella sp. PMI_857]|nr:hypothetical protein B0O99DRAFT_683054 [Bisporella sp. PMI_857]KAH8600246.1 hypothetical protein B0O99DRAFT_681935 [Bisporella sp. PMI_857]